MIIFTAFYKCGFKIFIKLIATFIMLTLLFGGIVFFLYTFTSFGRIIILKNGFCYFDIPPAVMIIASVIFVALIVYLEISSCKLTKACIYEILIRYNSKEIKISAILDTGNNLYELVTRKPVIIAEYEYIKDNLLFDLSGDLKGKIESNSVSIDAVAKNDYRIVKLNTAAGEGFIFAFEPEDVVITKNGREINRNINACIGVVNRRLSYYGEFSGIMHPDFVK